MKMVRVLRALILTVMLAALGTPAEAVDMTGTWEGKERCGCFDEAGGKSTERYNNEVMEVTQDGTDLNIEAYGELFNGNVIDHPRSSSKGEAALIACNTEAANKALSDIATGTPTTLAITNKKGSWRTSNTDVSVSDNKLSGSAWFVQDAMKSDRLVVSAKGDQGIGLYLVNTGVTSLKIIPDGIIDLTRDQAHLHFDGVEAIELAAPGNGDAALTAAMPSILTLISADMVGAGEWLLQTTVEYAKTRIQFERPLGFFQAVKHPLVNIMLDIDRAKSLVYNAACSIDCNQDGAEMNARMAKSLASDMAVFASSRAVQFHGGIGFTWECYVHLFFKRQMHNQVLFGDGKYQRTLLAEMVMGKAA